MPELHTADVCLQPISVVPVSRIEMRTDTRSSRHANPQNDARSNANMSLQAIYMNILKFFFSALLMAPLIFRCTCG